MIGRTALSSTEMERLWVAQILGGCGGDKELSLDGKSLQGGDAQEAVGYKNMEFPRHVWAR